MYKKTFLLTILSILCLAMSCKSTERTSEAPGMDNYHENDNSPYLLHSDTLLIESVGTSSNQQMAANKARANALKLVCDSLDKTVHSIVSYRGIASDTSSHLTIKGYHTINQRFTTFHNERGKRMYRCYLTIAVPLQPLLEQKYGQIDTSDSYGFFQFLRDYEQMTITKQK